jgi:small redox-active disulfide protein 2
MAELAIKRINVGDSSVGIRGLTELMEEMAGIYADKPDDEVRAHMLDRLGEKNYIADKAEDEYGDAFVREFRKFLGQACADEGSAGLDIKVLGVGCNQCDGLVRTIKEVLTELELPAEVEHVTDIKEIARRGIMRSPALLINGKTVAAGSVPPRGKIKKWLMEADRSR